MGAHCSLLTQSCLLYEPLIVAKAECECIRYFRKQVDVFQLWSGYSNSQYIGYCNTAFHRVHCSLLKHWVCIERMFERFFNNKSPPTYGVCMRAVKMEICFSKSFFHSNNLNVEEAYKWRSGRTFFSKLTVDVESDTVRMWQLFRWKLKFKSTLFPSS